MRIPLDQPPRRDLSRERNAASLCAAGLVLLALLASLLGGCAARADPVPAPPPVDVPALMGELERIHEAIIPALVERCRIHAGGRCL